EGVLPLEPGKAGNIVVVGPTANLKRPLAGGWTLRWIPAEEEIYPKDMLTVYTALTKEFASVTLAENVSDLKSKASRADAIVVAVGEMPYSEGFGSITDLNLPKDQIELIRAAQATGKPVVLVIIAGRPRLITEVYPGCNAVLFAGLPGFEGAQAIAEIISGKVNPSAKLSFNYPYAINRLLPHNHKISEIQLAHEIENPISLEPFGHGLSYTTFEYSNLSLSDTTITNGSATVKATVSVKNTGSRSGKEAVLWFIHDETASISRPVRELKYYDKITLEPGESKTVTFEIVPERDLVFPDKSGSLILEDGRFHVMVGQLKTSFSLSR